MKFRLADLNKEVTISEMRFPETMDTRRSRLALECSTKFHVYDLMDYDSMIK
jgi:hypothetical protein